MPVRILVVNRELRAQLKNGDTFTLNPSDEGTHLKGSVMEKVRFTHTIDVSWNAEATPTDLWTTSDITNPETGSGDVTQIRRGSGDFIADGFADGDSLDYFASAPPSIPVSGSATIQSVSSDTMILDSDIGDGGGVTYGDADFDGGNQTVFNLIGTEALTALKFKFGLIENNEAINFESKVDGTEQSYYVDGIGLGGPRSTAFVIGESSELFKGWQTGTFKARYVNEPNDDVQRFEVEHEFIILPYLKVDDEDTVFELTESFNSLKYAFQCEFRTVISNPNTSKIIKDDFKKGSTATFGENYNGFNTQYSLTSVAITNGVGDPIDALEIGTTNTVTAVIASEDATFTTAHPFIVYHSFLPTADVYRENADQFQTIWLYENKRNTIDAVANNGTILTNVAAVRDSAAQITVTFDVSYSIAQQATLTDQDEFVLAIGVADDTLLIDNSDKTVIEVLQTNYTKNTDVEGLMSVTQMGFFDHPTNFLTGTGYTDYIGSVEDGILVEADFSLDLLLNAVMETLSVNFVAYNPTTEDLFILQENPVDITSAVIVPEGAYNVQEINIDTTRGFTLADGDQFNFFKLTSSPLSGDDKPYNLQFGIKADWREWLPLPAANTIFYDNTQTLNGLNRLISNYNANGYQIRIMLNADVSNGAALTEYNFSSPSITIHDYDESTALDWVCTVETFDETESNSFGGNISTTENTLIKVTYDSPTIVVADTGLYWGIIRIEPQNNPSLPTIEPLSSLRSGVQNQLIPIAGATETDKSIESDNLVLKCLVDYTTLDQGTNYKPSSRFGLNDAAAVIGGKLKEDGDDKHKEDGDNKIVDP